MGKKNESAAAAAGFFFFLIFDFFLGTMGGGDGIFFFNVFQRVGAVIFLFFLFFSTEEICEAFVNPAEKKRKHNFQMQRNKRYVNL